MPMDRVCRWPRWSTASRTPRRQPVEAVFSFNARNFMAAGQGANAVKPTPGGFVFWHGGPQGKPWEEGAFSATVSDPAAKINHAWFRGGWFDALTMAWNDVASGACVDRPPVTEGGPSPGASLFVPLTLAPGQSKTIVLRLAWYVGQTDIRVGKDVQPKPGPAAPADKHRPWYAGRFAGIDEVTRHWRDRFDALRGQARRFSDCFYDSTFAAGSDRRGGCEPYDPQVAHRAAADRRPALVVGGLRRQLRLLPRIVHPCVELRPGHPASVSRAGTHTARDRVRPFARRARPPDVPQARCPSGP